MVMFALDAQYSKKILGKKMFQQRPYNNLKECGW